MAQLEDGTEVSLAGTNEEIGERLRALSSNGDGKGIILTLSYPEHEMVRDRGFFVGSWLGAVIAEAIKRNGGDGRQLDFEYDPQRFIFTT